MSNILLPKDTGSVILSDELPESPEGYEWVQIDGTEWTLQDNRGRVCVDIMLRKAYTMRTPAETQMDWSTWSANTRPAHWLRNKFPTAYRAHLADRMGYDPVHVVNGGQRVGDSQSANSHSGNITSGFWQLRVSSNGNVQTYGTYMDPRMLVDFSSGVNIMFHSYVNEIYLTYANNPLSPQGLVLSTDALHDENNAINSRHSAVLRAVELTSPNLVSPHKGASWFLDDYCHWLRSDFSINISTPKLLKWLTHNGLFYVDYLNNHDGAYSMYQPKKEYAAPAQLFMVNYQATGGVMIPTVQITDVGHNRLIDSISKHFGLIATER